MVLKEQLSLCNSYLKDLEYLQQISIRQSISLKTRKVNVVVALELKSGGVHVFQ